MDLNNQSEVKIREAVETDAVIIADLANQLGYPSEYQNVIHRIKEIALSNDHEAFVAEIDGKVVGWIHIFDNLRLESDRFSEIGGLVVDSSLRGKKIGNKLVTHAVEWAKSKGFSKVRVRCKISRKEAHQFYLKEGFIELKEQKVFERKV